MILVKPSHEIIAVHGSNGVDNDDSLQFIDLLIEFAGSTCYKSENKITSDSVKEFVKKINKLGHESVIEHSAMTVKFVTEIVVTANFREWRHIFKLRCSKAAHPQMRELMIPLHEECKELIPIIFDDIEY